MSSCMTSWMSPQQSPLGCHALLALGHRGVRFWGYGCGLGVWVPGLGPVSTGGSNAVTRIRTVFCGMLQ